MPVYLCDLNDDSDEGGNLKNVISADINEVTHTNNDDEEEEINVVFINFEN